jgi:hypothetical protein
MSVSTRSEPPPGGSNAAPIWVAAVEAICALTILLAVAVASAGGFRWRLTSELKLSITSPYRVLAIAIAAGLLRYVGARTTPIQLPRLVARLAWRGSAVLRDVRLPLLLFLTVFGAHAYFYNGGGWNQSARYDPIYSFVEPGTADTGSLRINRFVAPPVPWNTGDWAEYQGHYYSNKAPGGAFLGIPIYFTLFHLERMQGLQPTSLGVAIFNTYVLNLWISVFWSSIASVCLLGLVSRVMGFSQRDALFCALTYAFATLVFPYDTQFWAHPTAAAFLIIGHALLVRQQKRDTAFAGVFIGMSVLTEYVTLFSLPIAFAYLVLQRRRRPETLPFLVGLAPPIACLLLYQKLHFGGWLVTAEALSNPFFKGVTDFTRFSPEVLLALLVSWHRGALVFMPILAVAVVNAMRGPVRGSTDKWLFLLCVANAAGYLGVISSYANWLGGNATGPRYLIVSLPFWCLLLPALSQLRRPARVATISIACWSFVNMLVIATVNTMVRAAVLNPLYGELYPRFVRGQFAVQADPFYVFGALTPEEARRGVFNLGRLLGIQGAASTLPLLVFLAIAVGLLIKWSATAPEAMKTRPLRPETIDETAGMRDTVSAQFSSRNDTNA